MEMERNCSPDLGNFDRISALPDHLICHILSFLPTKDSVATSALSTRWRFLFAFVPDIILEFCKTPLPETETETEGDVLVSFNSRRLHQFLNVFRGILRFRDGDSIRKLRLRFDWMDEKARSEIVSLISAAVGFRIQELTICIALRSVMPPVMTFPGIFTCETLVRLQLAVRLNVPSLVFLPKVKVLWMSLLADSVQRLIQGCPLLEELLLAFYFKSVGDKDRNTKIDFSSNSIKRLTIGFFGGACPFFLKSDILESLEYFYATRYDDRHQVFIDAPNLTRLSYNAPVAGVSFTKNLNSLVGARIGAGYHYGHLTGDHAIGHLVRVQSAKSITLGLKVLEILNGFQDSIPTFKNLTSLEIQSHNIPGQLLDHRLSLKTLPSLFEKALLLEVLVFDKVPLGNVGEAEFECLLVEALPINSIQQLKEFKLKSFRKENNKSDFKLIEYIAKHGKALKKVTVSGFLEPSNCKRILSFKRVSEDCEFVLGVAKTYYFDNLYYNFYNG